jgi:1-acyl-sn-glycerol-3-phosphate acyltransferase
VGPGQTAHLDRLIGAGGSLLFFPEGTRSRDGRVGRLRAGAALVAAEHHLPIVPIYLSGTGEAMPRGHRWMVFKAGRPGPRHALEIRFGKPIATRTRERPSEVMERVRLCLAECGAETEHEPHADRAEHADRRQPA